MNSARVKWTEKLEFVGTGKNKRSVVMSSSDEENSTGASPCDLLLIALGGCTAVDVIEILGKKRQQLVDLSIDIQGERNPEPPRRFTHIHLSYRLRGRGLGEKAVRDAIELSKTKYCSVGATIQGSAEITYDYEILEVEE